MFLLGLPLGDETKSGGFWLVDGIWLGDGIWLTGVDQSRLSLGVRLGV